MSDMEPLGEFVKCPFCSGHEMLGADALREIAMMLSVRRFGTDSVTAELLNIRNVILNHLERAAEPAEEEPPICPTPDKAKYGDLKHATPNAVKYKQHPYQCECGYWHLSKQTAVAHQAKVNTPAADADEFDAIDPLML